MATMPKKFTKPKQSDMGPIRPIDVRAPVQHSHLLCELLESPLGLLAKVAVAGLVTLATLYVAWEANSISLSQAEGLKKQNDNQISFHNQVTQSQAAQLAYEDVRDILLDSDSSISAQIYALRRVPEAMKASVDVIDSSGIRRVYPNEKPMKTLLQQYLRADRSHHGAALDRKCGMIADELIKLLHKLGARGDSSSEHSIWNPPSSNSRRDASPGSRKWGEIPRSDSGMIDLSHLHETFFVGANLPYLFHSIGSPRIVFREGSDFGSTNFYRASLVNCSMKNATFRSCNLAEANLTGADLTGANFEGANMTGIALKGAKLTGALHTR